MPVTIDSVNHSALTAAVQVNALGDVELEGTVRNEDGTPSDDPIVGQNGYLDSITEVEDKTDNGTLDSGEDGIFWSLFNTANDFSTA